MSVEEIMHFTCQMFFFNTAFDQVISIKVTRIDSVNLFLQIFIGTKSKDALFTWRTIIELDIRQKRKKAHGHC
jgi:hypothetical protein